jgi:hypothetical protein
MGEHEVQPDATAETDAQPDAEETAGKDDDAANADAGGETPYAVADPQPVDAGAMLGTPGPGTPDGDEDNPVVATP